MNKSVFLRNCAICLLTFISLVKVNAQTSSHFHYDSVGNRTDRHLNGQKSAYVNFPALENDIKPLEKLTEFESCIKIYPNPTRGIVKISLENFPEPIKGELRIYNLNGTILKQLRLDAPLTEIDVNDLPDGIYVIRLLMDGNSLDYKIIKQH
jgi:hypothetical protein